LPERGAFAQEYGMYFKKTQQIHGVKFSQDIDGAFHQRFPYIHRVRGLRLRNIL